MRKFLFLVALLIVTFSFTNVSAQQEAHIFIPVLRTDNAQYSQNQIIQAEFEIDNNSELRQSDINVVTSIVTNIDGQTIETNVRQHQNNLYLESNSSLILQVAHKVDANINGPAEFVLSAYLADGSLVGQKRVPVQILNSNVTPIISFENAYVLVNDEKFDLQSGPTVSEGDSVSVVVESPIGLTTDMILDPKIEIFNRTALDNVPEYTIEPALVSIAQDGMYSFDLPTDINPKVYEVKLSFSEDNGSEIIPFYFRYIIDGPIGTIINVNSLALDVKKNEIVDIIVEYAGNPPNINNDQLTENINAVTSMSDEDIKNLTDEEFEKFLDEQQIKDISNTEVASEKAVIKVTLENDSGDVIGSSEAEVELNNSGRVVIPVEISQSSKGFIIKAEMIHEDGLVLSQYQTNLPSEKSLDKVYGTQLPVYVLVVLVILMFLIVCCLIAFLYKNLRHYAIAIAIPLIVSVGSLLYLNHSQAFTVHHAPVANAGAHFKVNSILSPGPADSISYAPGEAFNLHINASYVACSNSSHRNEVYGPSDDWWNFNLNGMDEALSEVSRRWSTFQSGKFTVRTGFWDISNQKNKIGDNAAYVLNRFAEWWVSPGILTGKLKAGDLTEEKGWMFKGDPQISLIKKYVPQDNTVGVLVYGEWVEYYTNTYGDDISGWMTDIMGKGGRKIFSSTTYGSGVKQVTKHEYTSQYNIDTSHTYYMPQEPGLHEFYFMLNNYARGNTASNRIVSQTVCVRGAGVCPDEQVETLVCPNLIGTFTQNDAGQIFKDGLVTNYTKDMTGNCVVPPLLCSNAYTEGETICIDGQQYTMSCSVDGTWLQIPTGETCLSGSYCVAQPVEVVPNETVTFTAYPSDKTYQWKDENRNEISGSVGRTYTTSFSSVGSYQLSVDITDDVTETVSCGVSVTCADRPDDHGQCLNGIQKTYSCQSDGTWGETTQSCGLTNQVVINEFMFNPNIADSSGQCSLELEAEGVLSCSLTDRLGDEINFSSINNSISVSGQDMSPKEST